MLVVSYIIILDEKLSQIGFWMMLHITTWYKERERERERGTEEEVCADSDSQIRWWQVGLMLRQSIANYM